MRLVAGQRGVSVRPREPVRAHQAAQPRTAGWTLGRVSATVPTSPPPEWEQRRPGRRAPQAPQAPQPLRAAPTSIEEIIVSLQSEAQLASDQTIKELIQSVLGQNYDIKMEVGEPGEWCFPG
ncbi:hypothetical protein CB1_001359007 [Camelus ferus]|nr:hypothetical protein CB1_001359007 [Camelus ferus]